MKSLTPDDAPLAGGPDELATLFASARRDELAAACLYARCQPLLAAWLRRRFPAEVASDAAHEALVAAFAVHTSFHSGRPLLPWLRTLAFREAIDVVRREKRRAERERVFVEREAGTGGRGRAERCVEALSRCLAGLSERQRNLIVRRYVRGESSESIAASDGRKRSAVAVEIHRVCQKLRKALEAQPAQNRCTASG